MFNSPHAYARFMDPLFAQRSAAPRSLGQEQRLHARASQLAAATRKAEPSAPLAIRSTAWLRALFERRTRFG